MTALIGTEKLSPLSWRHVASEKRASGIDDLGCPIPLKWDAPLMIWSCSKLYKNDEVVKQGASPCDTGKRRTDWETLQKLSRMRRESLLVFVLRSLNQHTLIISVTRGLHFRLMPRYLGCTCRTVSQGRSFADMLTFLRADTCWASHFFWPNPGPAVVVWSAACFVLKYVIGIIRIRSKPPTPSRHMALIM